MAMGAFGEFSRPIHPPGDLGLPAHSFTTRLFLGLQDFHGKSTVLCRLHPNRADLSRCSAEEPVASFRNGEGRLRLLPLNPGGPFPILRKGAGGIVSQWRRTPPAPSPQAGRTFPDSPQRSRGHPSPYFTMEKDASGSFPSSRANLSRCSAEEPEASFSLIGEGSLSLRCAGKASSSVSSFALPSRPEARLSGSALHKRKHPLRMKRVFRELFLFVEV